MPRDAIEQVSQLLGGDAVIGLQEDAEDICGGGEDRSLLADLIHVAIAVTKLLVSCDREKGQNQFREVPWIAGVGTEIASSNSGS